MVGPPNFGLPRIAYPIPSGTIPVASLEIADAPSVIGGNANGPAVEFHAASDGTIASRLAGSIGFNTRTDLAIAGLDLPNAYTQNQTQTLATLSSYTIASSGASARLIINAAVGFGAGVRYQNGGVSQWESGPGAGDGSTNFNFFDNTAAFILFQVQKATGSLRGRDADAFGTVNGMVNATYLRTLRLTVATLPAAATVGAGVRATVIDALAPAYLAALVGGGAVFSGALCDGAVWYSA